jgi:hypothetical protein
MPALAPPIRAAASIRSVTTRIRARRISATRVLRLSKGRGLHPCAVANSLNPAACDGAKVPGGFRKKLTKAAHAQEASSRARSPRRSW